MATAARRTIHVHDAEISTEHDSLFDYAEAFAWLLTVVALAAAVWIAAAPGEGADLAQPDTTAPVSNGQFTRAPGGEAYQPTPGGSPEIAVYQPDVNAVANATAVPTFGAPFG
jgi:hypothetical protein